MTRNIEHVSTEQRFQWLEGGQRCVLDYELHDGVMIITHTGVPRAVGGRYRRRPFKAALETAREQGWKVRPLCSYVDAYIRRHRGEYDDLLKCKCSARFVGEPVMTTDHCYAREYSKMSRGLASVKSPDS